MIRKIEALRYGCLRFISRPLEGFHILVGPNASGKTTLLDAIAFLGDLVSDGLEAAVEKRTADLRDLVWRRTFDPFELAIELSIPAQKTDLFENRQYDRCRYEIAIGPSTETGETSILAERVLLLPNDLRNDPECEQQTLFPVDRPMPDTLALPRLRGTRTIVHKVHGSNDNFYYETGAGWDHSFRLGPRRSALANLPEDDIRYPVATWLKGVLNNGIQRLVLNSAAMRRPSPPGRPVGFQADGSNLPWVISSLHSDAPDRFAAWIARMRSVLPDLKSIRTVERPEDRHCYLVFQDRNGLEAPSWTVSDGTLRLLALTLPAYLPEFTGIYLIEEPENGIHPRAVETVFLALSSIEDVQILLTTHSPVIVSLAEGSQVICFSRTETGATDMVLSTENPALREWQGETDLGSLFADGVLG
ncbi:MAG: ATP-binding protein [Candidatus Latescibacteria bacterium]|nr:ATP-binding protein [Candidatus Latescibacterota bacterium]